MPDTAKPPKLLELRINSVTDAKAIVQHQAEIFSRVSLNRLDGIEFIVAKEVDPLVGQYIDRLFRTKTFKQVVEVKNGNVLGTIPHLLPPKPKPVPTQTQLTRSLESAHSQVMMATTPPKRRGRPPKVKQHA